MKKQKNVAFTVAMVGSAIFFIVTAIYVGFTLIKNNELVILPAGAPIRTLTMVTFCRGSEAHIRNTWTKDTLTTNSSTKYVTIINENQSLNSGPNIIAFVNDVNTVTKTTRSQWLSRVDVANGSGTYVSPAILKNNTTYYSNVGYYSDSGYTATGSIKTPDCTTTKPASFNPTLTVKNSCSGTAVTSQLTWTKAPYEEDATDYKVEIFDASNMTAAIKQSDIDGYSTVTQSVTNLPPGKDYKAHVIYYAYSNTKTIDMTFTTPICSAPTTSVSASTTPVITTPVSTPKQTIKPTATATPTTVVTSSTTVTPTGAITVTAISSPSPQITTSIISVPETTNQVTPTQTEEPTRVPEKSALANFIIPLFAVVGIGVVLIFSSLFVYKFVLKK